MIDSHTHLSFCDPPDTELVEAATEAGVHRILTVGTNGESCRAALQSADDFPQVYAAIGRHPNEARGFDEADLAELAIVELYEQAHGQRQTVLRAAERRHRSLTGPGASR